MQQVIADAEAFGDDLNVDPETFRPAAEARTNTYIHAPLQPPNHLQGKFAPAEQLPGGWYHQANDSGATQADIRNRHSGYPTTAQGSRRTSWQSLGLGSESSRSTLIPRRVESIVGIEAVTAYQNQQAAQRPAGGAYYEAPRLHHVHRTDIVRHEPTPNVTLPENAGNKRGKQRATESVQSVVSDSSVSLHFDIPNRTLESEIPTQVRSYTPTRAQDDVIPSLTLPVPTYQPGSSAVRNGRSPLARKSFTHLAPTSPTGERRDVEVEVRVPRRASIQEGEERRGRRGRRSISVDGQGRRRLSKRRQGSKEPRE